MTVAEAREAVKAEPKRWKVALVEGSSFPLLDSPESRVRLFKLKKEGNDALRKLQRELVAAGYKQKQGALSRGFLWFELEGEIVAAGLDYPGRIS